MIKNTGEALVYMTECTLATVAYMAGLKSKNKSEFRRQINIAQKGIDWIRSDKTIELQRGTRVYDIIKYTSTVLKWLDMEENIEGK